MAGGLKATAKDQKATARAVVILKNSEKCSMILNCKEQSHASGVKPKGFRLPKVEKMRDRLVFDNKKLGWWMCKLDPSNFFWSIRLPARWRHSFKVYVPGEGGGGYRWTRLPFGWAFSPVVCQKLVSGIVSGVLARLQTEGFVHLDDILLVATKSKVRRGARCVARKLRKAGFLMSPKSVYEPTQKLDFIGKWFDTEEGKMGNRQGVLVGILGLWVLVVIGPFDSLLMSRLLGRLEWEPKPNADASAFMSSAYQWMQGSHIRCGLPLLRSLMTAMIFAILPQRLKPDVCPVLPGRGVDDMHVLFCDRLRMAADFSWVCTSQVGATNTGGAPSGLGLCSRLNCLPLCAVFN